MSARVALISFWRYGNPLNPVGASLLAMAECQPASMLDVPALSNACHTTKQGGSELARDGGVSAGINAGCADLIASKLAPTGFSGAHKCLSHHKTKVGASLLAMAECQPVSMLDVPALSRASSLPQVSVTPTNACHTTKQGGSELARDGGVSAGINAGCAGLIASKLAPTGDTTAGFALRRYTPKHDFCYE